MKKKYLKWILIALAVVALAAILGFCAPIVYFIASAPSCMEDSDAVAYARSLSKERLAELYKDMEEYSENPDTPFAGYITYHKNSVVPKPFADLNVKRIRPKGGNIIVEGCFDHYVYMDFEGIGSGKEYDKKRQVVLWWGEHPPTRGSQVLWAEETE